MPNLIDQLAAALAREEQIRFAYVFGSQARGDQSPSSDIDLAVCIDGVSDLFTYRLKTLERLSRDLATDQIDLVILNTAPPLLKYQVIKDGQVLKEDRAPRVAFETETLREYLDTVYLRQVQSRVVREKFQSGSTFG